MGLYSEIDLPHRPGQHPDWQESWVLVFRDRASGLVGFVRTGAYVNRGTTQSHWGMALPDGLRFRRCVLDRPLEPGDRTETSASSGMVSFTIPGMAHARFTASDADADLDLRLYDYFPSQEWEAIGASRSHDGDHSGRSSEAHGHPESAGRLEGRVRIGDRVIEITDGIGYRDHGFGPRVLTVFRSARWHAGTVGPALSYSLFSMHAEDGSFHRMGYVMMEGDRRKIRDFHTVNCSLGDGFSTLGGWSVVELEDGRRLQIEANVVDGMVTSSHIANGGPGSSSAGVEGLSVARWNGHEGVADFNMIDNAHRGDRPVGSLLMANTDEGITRRERSWDWVRAV
jgi:hypothetical protein